MPTQLPHFAIGRQAGITQCGVTLENLKALFFGGANWAQRNTSDHETMDLILDQFRHAQHTTAQRSTGNTTANCSTRDCAAETRSECSRTLGNVGECHSTAARPSVRWALLTVGEAHRRPAGSASTVSVSGACVAHLQGRLARAARSDALCARGTHCTALHGTHSRTDGSDAAATRSKSLRAPQQALSDCCTRCMLYAVCVARCLVCVAR